MSPGTITCSQCGHAFQLFDALTHQMREHLKTELQAEVVKRETEAKRKLDEVKSREGAQIERVIRNTVGLYGDMQGIIGGQIPLIPALELDGSPKALPSGSTEAISEEQTA